MSRQLVAAYRLQFREGTTFETARDLVPYLQTLGVSHFYASPNFAASPGSTHGYDVVDYYRLEEDFGSEVGFDAMSGALMEQSLGLVLDFVPRCRGHHLQNRRLDACREHQPRPNLLLLHHTKETAMSDVVGGRAVENGPGRFSGEKARDHERQPEGALDSTSGRESDDGGPGEAPDFNGVAATDPDKIKHDGP